MVLLAIPHVRFHRSFLDAADEFRAAGQWQHDGILSLPADGDFPGITFTREGLEEPGEFARLVANRVGDADDDAPRPPGWAATTHWWMADPDRPDEFVGGISLRHSIDHPMLASIGGHVGYGVRPGARRRGFASDALRQVVPLAAARGIPRLLVTCDLDNEASARTIEANGGELEGELRGKRRYWIATDA
ncbi:Acetyltransferase (GNAT) domain-containing protein [Pedococcus dokdonensis]|uniref:Acetyltransferase (GNAT) domain-containing protein n=1 Tax=Pedococcus dokdonensis TaxID=443156 RepID=A0A1H0RW65_9MICO|nr:GNAT family N-acetyltransferase [Pedococcus dokdonensis]SDP33645.1 Acetyltransferase (GNAT) domain-containing protein [Pedococcus dokdonensis]